MQRLGPTGWGCCRLIHSDFAGAKLTFAVSLLPPLFSTFPFFSSFTARFPRVFHRFLFPTFVYAIPFVFSSVASPLNGPAGGFGYTGMQSSSHSQYSYSLSQGSRARKPSSDVSEALYNLDRVLQGKSVANKHEGSGVTCTPASVCVSQLVRFYDICFRPVTHCNFWPLDKR